MTYPFVLSWSVLEAMACGALVIGSDTPPVREVIRTGHNGMLVPFFDTDALAEAILGAVSNPQASAGMRAAARRTVERRFRLEDCLLRQRDLMTTMTGRAAAA
ncbi:GDP-mannose-dependent alpha-(1-2)-phosphatidylinositol mannosyltransferase [compost metagenome]